MSQPNKQPDFRVFSIVGAVVLFFGILGFVANLVAPIPTEVAVEKLTFSLGMIMLGVMSILAESLGVRIKKRQTSLGRARLYTVLLGMFGLLYGLLGAWKYWDGKCSFVSAIFFGYSGLIWIIVAFLTWTDLEGRKQDV